MILIGEDGKKMGEMSFDQAKKVAKDMGKDVISVANDILRICDAGKLKYEKKQKEKKIRAQQQKMNKTKEIRMNPNIDIGDLEIKVDKMKLFLEEGLKTKIIMRVKKYQIPLKKIGVDKINNIIKFFTENKIATIEKPISSDSNIVSVTLIPYKK